MCRVIWVASEWFELLLNWTALSSCVFSAPPPSEPGRRWLRSDSQQQILCLQNCQQRQFLSLLHQWQESHIQRSRCFTPEPWYWPGPQQVFDLTGNCGLYNTFLKISFSFTCNSAFLKSCFHHPILSRVFLLFILYTSPSPVGARYFIATLSQACLWE